jgi:hypothetical protein
MHIDITACEFHWFQMPWFNETLVGCLAVLLSRSPLPATVPEPQMVVSLDFLVYFMQRMKKQLMPTANRTTTILMQLDQRD